MTTQQIAVGPAASQVAIKQLGTNGGGFFNVNSAHPLENPTPLSNFLEMLAILLIPAALCYTFGEMVGDRRQGWAILAAMMVVFVAAAGLIVRRPNNRAIPCLAALGVDQTAIAATAGRQHGRQGDALRHRQFGDLGRGDHGGLERSVNSMHDSFTPLGGLVPMWLMQLGEVIFGGVGSGLYGMLVFAIVAVFIAGLMVGRTPEYLGKKIGAFEMKMAALVILLPCAMVLVGTACAVVARRRASDDLQSRPARLQRGALRLFLGAQQQRQRLCRPGREHAVLQRAAGPGDARRPVLGDAAGAGDRRFAGGQEDTFPPGPGTLPTHTPLFVVLLVAVVIVVGALELLSGAGPGADRRAPHARCAN